MKLVLKGSATSGWYSPPRGTHSGERHRTVGSGKVRLTGKRVPGRKLGQIPKPNQGTLRHVLSYSRGQMANAAAGGGLLTAEDIERRAINNLREHVEGRPVSVNVDAKTAHLILDDGRFKNQHETGTSGGTLSPRMRRDAELRAFTYDTAPSASDLPIYGCVDDGPKWSGRLGYRGAEYGDITFVLKDSVRARTTITVDDSLSRFSYGMAVGTPLTKPGLGGIDGDWRTALKRDWRNMSYIEAQIHGGVTLADVDKIIVRKFIRMPTGDVRIDALGVKARALGIEIDDRRV